MSGWNLFDGYSLRARLFPALVTLLPAALAVISWTGPGDKGVLAVWTLIVTAGGTYLLAAAARNRGKQLEAALWESWGGAPTTQLLRHRSQGNAVMRERWHRSLSSLVSLEFPTVEREARDPAHADEIYEAGVKVLITRTYDRKVFPLVYKENVSYGFCRNLYGLRLAGLMISAIGVLSSGASIIWSYEKGNLSAIPVICMGISVLLLAIWIFWINTNWVKVPAFAYADRLLNCAQDVTSPVKAEQKKGKARNRS